MSKFLVLAEKPSVGRDIARVLKCNKKNNGYIENDKYIVTWAMGHLVTLSGPEAYRKEYKEWNLEDLPILPKSMKTEVIRNTSKQFYTIKKLLERKDVGGIIIATDAGREGELVARWIIEEAKVKKPIKRLWISSVTDKAISDGFKNLKDGSAYENLYQAAVARSEADWIVGINGTRALTVKHNAQLSCGRVQTPTLAMVEAREIEIRNFVREDYYGLDLHCQGLKFKYVDGSNNSRIFSRDDLEKLKGQVSGRNLDIVGVSRNIKKKYPQGLYNLTELQRDANNVFGYSPKETLNIMQNLYERHKILTYPRTDSKYISEDIVPTLKDRLKTINMRDYTKLANKIIINGIKTNKSFVDDKKVTDHHGIIPTEEYVNLGDLSIKELNIYEMVIKRFLAVFLPAFQYEEIKLEAKVGNHSFLSKTQNIVQLGFREVYVDEDEEEYSRGLVEVDKGAILTGFRLVETKGQTSPPERFTEGSLIMAMENPKRYMKSSSKELKEIIEDTGGIGTVATRADIMDKLFNSYSMEKDGKYIRITSKGSQLLDLVPEDLKSPELTAEWEMKLSQIERGKLNKDLFINEMRNFSKEIVDEIKNSDDKFKHDNLTRNKCPDCGKFLLEVKNKNGLMHICQDRECGFKKNVARLTNARCPKCKKKMEMRGEGEAKAFVCKCGYREKLTSFNERKSKEKSKVSKADVKKYMKQQDKADDEINNSLADALSKFKF